MTVWGNTPFDALAAIIPQELEAQALLLGEQLGAAEAKFRETGKALRR